MSRLTIYEVLEYGPLLVADEELGLAIGANGSYLNLYIASDDGTWSNTDCKAASWDTQPNAIEGRDGMYAVTYADALGRAEEWLDEIRDELFGGGDDD